MRLLLLGGTQEASALARRLAGRSGISVTLSLAGRTAHPAPSPVPMRVGGFGGVAGLARYLSEQGVDAVIDATHPFAAQMSAHAVEAARIAGARLARLTRPPWAPVPQDRWREVDTPHEAARALGEAPLRVFLSIGRLQAAAFQAAPQHHYVLRAIDAPAPDDLPPSAEVLLARPPFGIDAERDLLLSRGVDVVVSKNSGGEATRAKIDAARHLGLPVVMIRRPPVPAATTFHDLDAALGWIEAHAKAP